MAVVWAGGRGRVGKPGQQILQGRQGRRRRAGQSRGVGGDTLQGAQQQGQAGALRFAVAVALAVFQGFAAFGNFGALILRRLGLDAVGRAVPVRTLKARAGAARFALQAQLKGYAHAQGEEAAVEQLDILEFIGGRLGPLRLDPIPPVVATKGAGYFFLPGKRLLEFLATASPHVQTSNAANPPNKANPK